MAPRHRVSLVTAETHGYYSRPRLSHGLALSDEAAAKIVLKPFDAISRVHVLAGTAARMIDREKQKLLLDRHEALDCDVLVLATGVGGAHPTGARAVSSRISDAQQLRRSRYAPPPSPQGWRTLGGHRRRAHRLRSCLRPA